MKIRVSFDFDGTLGNRHDIEEFVKSLLELSYVEVCIVTSRCEESGTQGMSVANEDIYAIAEQLGISFDHIFFTEHEWKHTFFESEMKEGRFYLFHFDDCPYENLTISERTKTQALMVGDREAFKKAEQLIENWYYSYLV